MLTQQAALAPPTVPPNSNNTIQCASNATNNIAAPMHLELHAQSTKTHHTCAKHWLKDALPWLRGVHTRIVRATPSRSGQAQHTGNCTPLRHNSQNWQGLPVHSHCPDTAVLQQVINTRAAGDACLAALVACHCVIKQADQLSHETVTHSTP